MSQTMEDVRKRNALMASTYIPDCSKGPGAFYNIGVGPLIKSEWRHWKELYPEMQLFGCEPNPVLYSQLLMKFPGRLFSCGISDKESIEMYMEPEKEKTFGRSSIFPVNGLSDKTIRVECITLNEFDQEVGSLESILLWMDIEGSELIALKSGEELLKSGRVHTINLELRDKPEIEGWPTATEITEYLSTIGFKKAVDYNNQVSHWDTIFTKVK